MAGGGDWEEGQEGVCVGVETVGWGGRGRERGVSLSYNHFLGVGGGVYGVGIGRGWDEQCLHLHEFVQAVCVVAPALALIILLLLIIGSR